MVRAVFGTAHLFAVVEAKRSVELLGRAAGAGFAAFDTAPSYGHGDSEPALGTLLPSLRARPLITTKVGIEPVGRPSGPVRVVKAGLRRLPAPLVSRLRPERPAGHGAFAIDLVRASVERSLSRLGRIDRLALHEIRPDEITDDLLGTLSGYRDRGDVGELGVATGNLLTVPCLLQAPELLTFAHFEVGPFAARVVLPPEVTGRVGHGALGAGGSALRRLQTTLDIDPVAAEQWNAAIVGTRWSEPDGLAVALLARAAAEPLSEVIVATSRPAAVAGLADLIAGDPVLPPTIEVVLEQLIARSPSAPNR